MNLRCSARLVAPVLVATLTATMATPAPAADLPPEQAMVRVAVSVATVWSSPTAPRLIDAAAISVPADPAAWLRGLTTADRRGLSGRVETQVLLGQEVVVLERRSGWVRVAVPGQPSPKAAAGYPGWIPAGQLVQSAAAEVDSQAVVKRRTAWAYVDAARTDRVMKLSYGTRLPVLELTERSVAVAGPDGRTLWLPAGRVAVVGPDAPARRPRGAAVVAEARKFLRLPYLWGGTSGFGFDCSGLTHAVYAQLGIIIPRDATPQFAEGRTIRKRKRLHRGDLVFFRNASGSLHHVGIYAGRGRMIHSPRTGQPVQYASITSGLWRREFAGGRRYL